MLPVETMYQLADREECPGRVFLKLLMERRGNGRKTTIRQLANAAGVSHSLIGNLLTGISNQLPYDQAQRVALLLGVDMGCLWEESGRTAKALATAAGPRRGGARV